MDVRNSLTNRVRDNRIDQLDKWLVLNLRLEILVRRDFIAGIDNLKIGLLDVLDDVREAVGSDTEEKHGPAKPGEVRRSVLDASLIRKEMGWEPKVGMKDGMRETVAFFRRQIKDPDAR